MQSAHTGIWFIQQAVCLYSVLQNKSSKTRTPVSRGKPTPPSKKATPQGPSPNKRSPLERKSKPGSASKSGTLGASRSEVKKSLSFDQSKRASPVSHSTPESEGSSLLWVDKYRPRSLKNLIGQQGDQSCANKLLRWLQNWHKHHSGNTKAPSQYLKFVPSNIFTIREYLGS